MSRHIVLAGLALCILMAVASARAEVLGVDAVLQAALAHSNARHESAEATKAAAARVTQASAQERPQLELGASAARYNGLEASTLGALTIPELDTRYKAAAALRQPLYTGGRLSRQTEAARFTHRSADNMRSAVTAGVALDALTTYWSWSHAFQAVAAARAAVERMQALDNDVRHQHAAGLATDNDRLATEVELERARLRHATAQHEMELARAQIAYLTGTPVPPDATPEVAPAPKAQTLPAEADLLAAAYSNRAERVVRSTEVMAAMAQVASVRAERGPTVNLRAGYEYANPNPLFFPPEDEWQNDAFVGVDLNWNLWDSGLTRGRLAEAKAERMQAEYRRVQEDETITLEVSTARIRLQEAFNRHAVALRAQVSAQRNLETATALWKNGLARQSEVLDAQARLADADETVVGAVSDIAVGRATLDYACGTLSLPEGQ